ncbi:MAG: Fucose 4-O-acetylase and related acetyltransferase [bacterium P3]|nr:MAG: Fucose 4-O-acetylase and related acetyltransferase [bacterium P3]KWW42514.1 MAG: Fucose 4-O-acetylase and related acetyltransferase [bacterium F083]
MIKSMRLPLYFFLSGCFFKKYDGFFDFVARKTNKLLIPFIFWFLITSLLLPLLFSRCGIVQFPKFQSVKSVLIGFIHGNFPNPAIWFLLCLFWVNIIFYLITLIAKRHNNSLPVIIALSIMAGFVGVTLGNFSIRIPFYIDSAFTAVPFFTFGYLTYRHSSIAEPGKYDWLIPFVVSVLFVLMYFFSPFYSLKFNRNVTYYSCLFIYLSGFIGALSIILLSKWIKRLPVFNYWGRYSIMILVSHGMIYHLVGYLLGFTKLSAIWCFALNLLFTMGICSLLIPLFIRYMPHVTAQKDIIPVG